MSLMTNDEMWDRQLGVRTSGRDASNADTFNYPYEPTDYCVLERVAESGLIRKRDRLIDYGCGKGRVSFFLSSQVGCKCVGVEFDERIYGRAMSNRKEGGHRGRTEFLNMKAQDYEVPADATVCFFFNPFSVEILAKVMTRIIGSYYETPRDIRLFFYYPSDEYISFLMTHERLAFCDEIDCRDLFRDNDPRNRVVVFEIDRNE